jgi:serine/threonine-protein kinase RsbW
MTLMLPSDARSVPLVRSVIRHSLEILSVTTDCSSDIEVALTEACTNVLAHSADGRDYQVIVGVQDDTCILEVSDDSFHPAVVPSPAEDGLLIDPNAENGRGLQLMRALVDTLDFDVHEDDGTVVRMSKALVYAA